MSDTKIVTNREMVKEDEEEMNNFQTKTIDKEGQITITSSRQTNFNNAKFLLETFRLNNENEYDNDLNPGRDMFNSAMENEDL